LMVQVPARPIANARARSLVCMNWNVANSREPEKRKKFVRYYCDKDLKMPRI
jgi:hypothetical protein